MNWFEHRIKSKFIRTRTVIYAAILTVLTMFLSLLLYIRVPTHINVIRDPKILPMMVSADDAANYYKIFIGNKAEQDVDYVFETQLVSGNDFIQSVEPMTDLKTIHVKANSLQIVPMMVHAKVHLEKLGGIRRNVSVKFIVRDINDPENYKGIETLFTIPGDFAQ